jgi:hypothetical protein
MEVAMRHRWIQSCVVCVGVLGLLGGCSDSAGGEPTSATQDYEGDEPGECEDDADNDRDQLFDCDDPDCAGAPVCNGSGTTTVPGDDQDASGGGGTPLSDSSSSEDGVSGPTQDGGSGTTGEAIVALLASHGCANVGCHDEGAATAGLDVTTLGALFAQATHGPAVVPCDPEASSLYTKLLDPPPYGFLMPIGGVPVSDEDVEVIRSWIAGGAGQVTSCEVEAPDAGVEDAAQGGEGDIEQGGFPDGGPEAAEDAFEPVAPGDGPTFYVSKDGEDGDGCGSEDAPCVTIAAGLHAVEETGGTVMVGAGEYVESELFVPSAVWLVSADGPLAAKIYSNDKTALRFWEVDDAGIDGFEIYGDWNDGSPGDGLIRIFDANRITVRNGVVRDAPSAQDLIKITGALQELLLENLILLNPGKPSGGNSFQQAVEIYGSKAPDGETPSIRDVTIRGCWFLQTSEVGGDDMLFMRASVAEVLIENNIFGPGAGPGGAARPAVHIGTYNGPQPDQNFPEARDVVVRNNIFVGLRGDAALGISNSHHVRVYSNVFYDNSGSKTRSVVAIRGNILPVDDVTVVDNIFLGNAPSKSGGDLIWIREGGVPDTFVHDYNVFFDNVLTSDVDYQAEEMSLVEVDPQLDNPLTPPNWTVPESLDVIHSLYGGFLLGETSPAINAGIDAVGMDGHPAWSDASIRRWDVLGEPRPLAGQWDIGVHEPMP